MNRRIIVLFLLLAVLGLACKKIGETVTAIKDKIIAGYWYDLNIVIKVDDTEAYVVDFGSSTLGSNKDVFSTSTPYIRNIKKTGDNSWEAEIAKSTIDNFKKLKSITYEKTTITLNTDADGNETITLSNADPKSETLTRPSQGYVPDPNPYHDQPTSCDSTGTYSNSGNTFSLKHYWRGDKTITDFPIRSGFYLPFNHSLDCDCHYKITGKFGSADLLIYLSHKPIISEVFTIKDNNGSMAMSGELDSGIAVINFEHSFNSITNGGFINVDVSGGKITASASNIFLQHDSVLDTTVNYLKVSFSLTN